MRRFAIPLLAALLSACVTMHGPQTITIPAAEIEGQIQADLGGVLEMLNGLDAGRPEVSLAPVSGRLLVERKGMALPDLPLMTLPAERLRLSDVAYEATGVGVGYAGLTVDIAPR